MSTSDSYDAWAGTYDSMGNKTRDLEAEVLRNTFLNPHYGNIVELGCGTGKNTGWLSKKITAQNVDFIQSDITKPWPVKPGWANLITCSLVMEHIENLEFIFEEAEKVLKRRGKFYICELHPWKQYSGSQARFETEDGLHKPMAFVHHISDFLNAARKHDFTLLDLNEYFDDRIKEDFPRLISFVFESKK